LLVTHCVLNKLSDSEDKAQIAIPDLPGSAIPEPPYQLHRLATPAADWAMLEVFEPVDIPALLTTDF